MKCIKLKLPIISALSIITSPVIADWTVLPATGVSVSGGVSAYVACNPTGNFGSGFGTLAPVKPTATTDACALMPTSETTVPDPSYTGLNALPIVSATRTITMNNVYTNFTNVNIGDVREIVWRRQISANTYQCIYAMKINLSNIDYDLTIPYTQYFAVHDIARAGWTGLDLDIAYSAKPSVAEPTYRVGRTFTAVQHRPAGYSTQPFTGLGSSPSINGINSFPGTASAMQQQADIDTNWVNFTTDVNFLDSDLSTSASSGTFYVRTNCSGTSLPVATANAIRLRQTFQEQGGPLGLNPSPFIEIGVTGYMPTLGSGSVLPIPTSPY